ncbi:hypothetical protein [Desulfosporosinus metallidurans]|uniref:Uncharacterized protein n=1 Tax=Desulfosporosinus metallidurans TaxID=1888891 RepID=A0A1Q8QRG4_9FIRM|nr:hypothetical protein [Desulfosporosinus metallidurans]OLN29953.1 hypothetical protein DSOL_3293 [Desulfosporosinus metallidurans]
MAKVIITIESNWDHLTRAQKDCLCRRYANVLISSYLKNTGKDETLIKTLKTISLNEQSIVQEESKED